MAKSTKKCFGWQSSWYTVRLHIIHFWKQFLASTLAFRKKSPPNSNANKWNAKTNINVFSLFQATSYLENQASGKCNGAKEAFFLRKLCKCGVPGQGVRVKFFNRVEPRIIAITTSTQSKGFFTSSGCNRKDVEISSCCVEISSVLDCSCFEVDDFGGAEIFWWQSSGDHYLRCTLGPDAPRLEWN